MGQKFSAIFLCTILFSSVSLLTASEFPADDFLPGWKADSVERYEGARGLFDYMDGGAEVYLEYQFIAAQVREYTSAQNEELCIEIYKFVRPVDACGIFSLDTTGTPVAIGQGGRASPSSVRFWKNNRYVKIFLWETNPELTETLLTAARQTAAKIGAAGLGTAPTSIPVSELPSWLENLFTAGLNPAFVQGELTLKQIAGPAMPQDIPFDEDFGAAWMEIYNEYGKAGCLLLRYYSEKKAEKEFVKLSERLKKGIDYKYVEGKSLLALRPDGQAEGLHRVEEFVIWVVSSESIEACGEAIETIESAIK